MIPVKRVERTIGLLLTSGVLLSSLLVLSGGFLFLYQHGGENIQNELLQNAAYAPFSFKQALYSLRTFSASGMIESGLFLLVFTQIARVGLLVLFYISQKDYWFTTISFFILFILIYSITLQR